MTDETVVEETTPETVTPENPTPEAVTPEAPVTTTFDMAAFRETITDEDLRKHAERFNSPLEMTKANKELRQKMSKAVIPPSKNASEDEIATYRKVMGVPETPDGYEYPAMPPGTEMPENLKTLREEWSAFFHENHVPKSVVAKLVDKYGGQVTKESTDIGKMNVEHLAQSQAKLKEEWGSEYETNMQLASLTARELLGDDYEEASQIKTVDGKFVMNNPVFAKVFSRIGREMNEADFMVSVTDDQMDSLQEQADEAAAKAKKFNAEGKRAQAQKWDEKEREILGKIIKATKKE